MSTTRASSGTELFSQSGELNATLSYDGDESIWHKGNVHKLSLD